MDPAVLNYLQSQQNNQQQAAQTQTQQGMGQAPYNPFDIGISKAIESARQSLGLTQKQQDKALRSSMLSFADNISQQPKQRGFFKNFASVGRALSPAIATYDQEEESALQQNNELANQILKYQGAEQDRLAAKEQNAWRRQHANATLGEQRRYHDLMNNFRKEKEANKFGSNVDQNGLVEGKYPAFASKVERTPYAKTLKGANHVIGQVDKVLHAYEDFEKKYPDSNSLLPYGIGAVTGKGKSLFSNFSSDETLQNEVKDRARINTLVGSFTKQFEKDLKGGILTENMLRRFQEEGIVPTKFDSLGEVQAKLAAMKEIAEEEALVSTYSLQKNAHVNINDLSPSVAPQPGTNQTSITLTNDDGDLLTIPANDRKAIQDAINDGYHE